MGLCGAGLHPRVSQHDPFPHPPPVSVPCVFEEVGKEWCEEKRESSLVMVRCTRQGRYLTCTGSETYYKKKHRQSHSKGMQGNAKRDQGMVCSGDMESKRQDS